MLLFRRPLILARSARVKQCVAEQDLCAQFQHLSLQETHVPSGPRRFFHTSVSCYKDRDLDHIDEKGHIKQSYLNHRWQFLANHHLLEDKIVFKEHVVYQNSHLYDIQQQDQRGISNLQRMLQGICPIAPDGKDYLVIHHFSQTHRSDWMILLNGFHEKYDRELHSHVRVKDGVIRPLFAKERTAYWQHVANMHITLKATFRTRKK